MSAPAGRSRPLRVAVLQGGRSLERQVSLRTGARVQDALQRLGHEPVAIDTGRDLVEELRSAQVDVAFVALHGGDGEDGTVQELLEAVGIPYTGSRPAACIRCADKILSKHLMFEAGIPTPDFHSFSEVAFKELGAAAALPDLERRLGFPLVVKPASQGSALGIKFAGASADVPSALVAAFSYDRRILLEHYIRGRDLAVSVIDSPDPGGEPQALPVVEAVPREEDFYDFEARYQIGRTTFVCPADLTPELSERARQLALKVYRLLGCRGVARVDLMLEQDTDELFVLETNAIPGLTETSLLPQAADAAGIGFDQLVEQILASGLSQAAQGA
jgi:D-alanine-D-alanine ligase